MELCPASESQESITKSLISSVSMLAGHSSSTSSPAADVNSTSISLAKRAAFAANLSAAFQTTVLAAADGAARNFSAARGLLPDPSRACLVPPPAGCNGNGVQNLTACTCNCNSGYSNDLSVSGVQASTHSCNALHCTGHCCKCTAPGIGANAVRLQ